MQGWRAHCLSHILHHFQLFAPSPVKFPIVKEQLLTSLRRTASMSATYPCADARYTDLHKPKDSPAPHVSCELALVSGTAQERAISKKQTGPLGVRFIVQSYLHQRAHMGHAVRGYLLRPRGASLVCDSHSKGCGLLPHRNCSHVCGKQTGQHKALFR